MWPMCFLFNLSIKMSFYISYEYKTKPFDLDFLKTDIGHNF